MQTLDARPKMPLAARILATAGVTVLAWLAAVVITAAVGLVFAVYLPPPLMTVVAVATYVFAAAVGRYCWINCR